MLAERTRNGAYCVAVSVPNGEPGNRSEIRAAGDEMSAKDDWFFRELREEMAENRRLEDEADQKQLALENGGR